MNNEVDVVDDNALELEILEVKNEEGASKRSYNEEVNDVNVKRKKIKQQEKQNRLSTILWKLFACRGLTKHNQKHTESRCGNTRKGCCGCGSRKRQSYGKINLTMHHLSSLEQ